MAHQQQIDFCNEVKARFPDHFRNKTVLDCGSLDINGNNRFLFEDCNYKGVDIVEGPNVDELVSVRKFYSRNQSESFGVIISTEMLEHDNEWNLSLVSMFNLLKRGGLLLITCAGDGRPEHGTHKRSPQDSPATNDYYRNVSNDMFSSVLPPSLFKEYYLRQFNKDLQFYGVKK